MSKEEYHGAISKTVAGLTDDMPHGLDKKREAILGYVPAHRPAAKRVTPGLEMIKKRSRRSTISRTISRNAGRKHASLPGSAAPAGRVRLLQVGRHTQGRVCGTRRPEGHSGVLPSQGHRSTAGTTQRGRAHASINAGMRLQSTQCSAETERSQRRATCTKGRGAGGMPKTMTSRLS